MTQYSESPLPEYRTLVAEYENTATHNDGLHARLTQACLQSALLREHRFHVEANQLGFGDRAFHPLWHILLREGARRFDRVRALEIGVFKGQVISLWSLIAREDRLSVEITALSPMAGKPAPRRGLGHRIRYALDRGYREDFKNGNFYDEADYLDINRRHFQHHGLEFGQVRLLRGFSTDAHLLSQLSKEHFEIIYVDGDHSFEGARHDFEHFGPLVSPGGWLVADDAGCDLPGTAFWKGHPDVTRAAQVLPSLGFRNILNVGHNRVYERQP